jgi:alpha-beta hydrolase superfamily lysophospholipase
LADGAPFHSDLADGPPGGTAFWLTADDGVRLRCGWWPGGTRGTIVLFPGRSEYVEKYGRTARAFHDAGFAVAAIDWRGQGLADRSAPDIGDVAHFDAYQRDVTAYLDALLAIGAPHPWVLVGHSMGGCIGLRALQAGLPFAAAIFTAPMWAIEVPRALRRVARLVARGPACRAGPTAMCREQGRRTIPCSTVSRATNGPRTPKHGPGWATSCGPGPSSTPAGQAGAGWPPRSTRSFG